MKQTMSKSKPDKGKEEKEKYIDQHQESKEEDRRQKTERNGKTQTSGSQGAREGCSAETK